MSPRIVIAVRGGPAAKSRLGAILSPEARAALTLAMLEDMAQAVAECAGVSALLVVTPTPDVAACARKLGAGVLVQPVECDGLNAALQRALAALSIPSRARPIVLMPGDLPLATPAALDELLGFAAFHDRVIVPAADGGTAAVVLAGAQAFAPRFGPDSRRRHFGEAADAGLRVAMPDIAGLGFDLDRPSDAARVLATAPGTRTAALLAAEAARADRPALVA